MLMPAARSRSISSSTSPCAGNCVTTRKSEAEYACQEVVGNAPSVRRLASNGRLRPSVRRLRSISRSRARALRLRSNVRAAKTRPRRVTNARPRARRDRATSRGRRPRAASRRGKPRRDRKRRGSRPRDRSNVPRRASRNVRPRPRAPRIGRAIRISVEGERRGLAPSQAVQGRWALTTDAGLSPNAPRPPNRVSGSESRVLAG